MPRSREAPDITHFCEVFGIYSKKWHPVLGFVIIKAQNETPCSEYGEDVRI
jgi:hypothetical protein